MDGLPPLIFTSGPLRTPQSSPVKGSAYGVRRKSDFKMFFGMDITVCGHGALHEHRLQQVDVVGVDSYSTRPSGRRHVPLT